MMFKFIKRRYFKKESLFPAKSTVTPDHSKEYKYVTPKKKSERKKPDSKFDVDVIGMRTFGSNNELQMIIEKLEIQDSKLEELERNLKIC